MTKGIFQYVVNITKDMFKYHYPDVLIYASRKSNDINWIKSILDKGVDVNYQDEYGCTGLYYAILRNKISMIKLLVERGANVNHKNKNGDSCLMIARESGLLEVVKFLLNAGADVNYLNSNSNNALMMTIELMGIIPMRFYHNNVGSLKQKYRHLEIIKLLLNHGTNTNHQDKLGNTALIYATNNKKTEIVKILLAYGDKSFNIENNSGKTALMYASYNGDIELVDLLLSYGDESFKDNNKALNIALNRGYVSIAKLLS